MIELAGREVVRDKKLRDCLNGFLGLRDVSPPGLIVDKGSLFSRSSTSMLSRSPKADISSTGSVSEWARLFWEVEGWKSPSKSEYMSRKVSLVDRKMDPVELAFIKARPETGVGYPWATSMKWALHDAYIGFEKGSLLLRMRAPKVRSCAARSVGVLM
jgi:hypothetical protein